MPLLAASSAHAQEEMAICGFGQPDSVADLVLREAVVSARRAGDAAGYVERLGERELRQMNSYSLADALRFLAGVQVKDYGGIGGLKTVDVHSVGSRHTAVSYDGVEISDAQNGVVDLGRFSPLAAGGLMLVSGMNPDILRPARSMAAASQVDIEPRKPVFSGKTYNLEAYLQGGSFGTFAPEVLSEVQLTPRLSAQLNAAWLTSTGRYRYRYSMDGGYDTTATRRNGDIQALRVEGALYGDMLDGDWHARVYVYSSRRGLPGAVVRNRLSHPDRQRDVSTFAQGGMRRRYGRLTMLLNTRLAYDYLHYLADPRRDPAVMYVSNHYHRHSAYASAAASYAFSARAEASLAADYALDGLHADLPDFARPLRHSLFLAASAKVRPGSVELRADALLTHAADRLRRDATTSRHTDFAPALSAAWHPRFLRGLTLRAFAKRSYRMPTFNDLYYTFIGNSSLRPERAWQYDAGIAWRPSLHGRKLRALSIALDAYRNDVSDKIIAVPAANQFRWTMMNIGRARTLGFDARAEAEVSLGEVGLGARASYTWQRAMDRSDSSSPYYKGQLAYVPRHAASLAADARWRGWRINVSMLYDGRRYDSSANTVYNRLPARNIVDVAAAREMKFRGWSGELRLAVNNVAGRQYEVVRCYPMPRRNYKITLLFNL